MAFLSKEFISKFLELPTIHNYFKLIYSKTNSATVDRLQLGPLGALMKLRISDEWRKNMSRCEHNVYSDTQLFTASSCHRETIDSVLSKLKSVMVLNKQSAPVTVCLHQPAYTQKPAAHDTNPAVHMLNPCQHEQLVFATLAPPKHALTMFNSVVSKRHLWYSNFTHFPDRFITGRTPHSRDVRDLSVSLAGYDGQHELERIEYHTDLTPWEDYKDDVHVITSVTSPDKILLAYLLDGFCNSRYLDDGSVMLQLHHKLSPYHTSVIITSPPASEESAQLQRILKSLVKDLSRVGVCVFQQPAPHTPVEDYVNYMDRLGVGYVIMLQEETLRNGVLSLRRRETTLTEQLHISDIKKYLKKIIDSY